jgi:NAD(P)-dependent dehydrogenase (short-subunit alcohol dehydrogenase family)
MKENQRVAIVTGGLQGIGLAIAQELTRQGVIVAIGSRRTDDPEYCIDAREAVGEQGVIAHLDLQKTSSVEACIDSIKRDIGSPCIRRRLGCCNQYQFKRAFSNDSILLT